MAGKLSVGILSPIAGTRDSLVASVEQTEIASVKLVSSQYSLVEDDPPTQQFLAARPDVILVDTEDQRTAIKALLTLHAALPDTWLLTLGPTNDPHFIIDVMQTGAREYLAKPVGAQSLAMAFERLLHERERVRPDIGSGGRIYSVISAKGGAGATAVTINLAASLAGVPGRRVAILDLNRPLGDAAAYLHVDQQCSLSRVFGSAANLDPAMLESFMVSAGKISVLSGVNEFEEGPTSFAALSKLLRVASRSYTDTFIDLSMTWDPWLLQRTAEVSAAVLVVTTPELPSVWRANRLLTFLTDNGCNGQLRLILNRDDRRSAFDGKEISKVLRYPIYWRLPNDYHAAFQAIRRGRSVVELSHHSRLAASYRRLAESLTGAACQGKRGPLGKLSFKISRTTRGYASS